MIKCDIIITVRRNTKKLYGGILKDENEKINITIISFNTSNGSIR